MYCVNFCGCLIAGFFCVVDFNVWSDAFHIFSNRFAHLLMFFFATFVLILCCCMFAGFSVTAHPRLQRFLVQSIWFFHPRVFIVYSHWNNNLFDSFATYFCFAFLVLSGCFSVFINAVLHRFKCLVLIFFYIATHICAICLLKCTMNLRHIPFFQRISLLCPPLTTRTMTSTCCIFCIGLHLPNFVPDPRFLSRFPLFSDPPSKGTPTAYIQSHLHPSVALHVPFVIFLQNMMFGEIAPAIRPQSGAARPFSCLYVLFLWFLQLYVP